jgi:hypothetical protein
MAHSDDGDGWDNFEWDSRGASDGTDSSSHSTNGRARLEGADDEGAPAGEGRWISSGGVLRWEESDEAAAAEHVTLRVEAESRWADDDIDLPTGAPSRLRLRAMRAWLARQRLLEQEAQGAVLLERRQRHADEDRAEAISSDAYDPLNLALAEHQAGAAEYEGMLETLADIENHAGLDRVLIEFYLWLGERIAVLAQAPEAPAEFRSAALAAEPESPTPHTTPTPLTHAEWRGRAAATLAARRHAERVSAPEPEE